MKNIYYNEKIDNKIDDYYVDEEKFKLKYELEKRASIARMGQIVISSTDNSIIGTTALDTCYGIVFYDRKNKFGMVGHAASSTKITTLCEMIKMLGNIPRTIEYAIIPGFRNVERKDYAEMQELNEYLEDNCPANIKLVPFQSDLGVQVCSNVLAYEFAFEVNTAIPVGNYLYYNGESLNNRKHK